MGGDGAGREKEGNMQSLNCFMLNDWKDVYGAITHHFSRNGDRTPRFYLHLSNWPGQRSTGIRIVFCLLLTLFPPLPFILPENDATSALAVWWIHFTASHLCHNRLTEASSHFVPH